MSFTLRGEQASSGQTLAEQLLRSNASESVKILGLRGSSARDIQGTFAEWHRHAKRTKCLKHLYSLSIVHQSLHYDMSHAQHFDLIERIEERLGLSHQPRLVVLQGTQDGLEHWHVVWSRIRETKDGTRAINFSNDWKKLRRVARDFCHDYGMSFPPYT